MGGPQRNDAGGRIDAEEVDVLYGLHSPAIRRFLVGLLRNDALADEALHTTFQTLIEEGHTTEDESRKAWLFRVAYNQAMLIRRRQKLDHKAQPTIAELARQRRQQSPIQSLEDADQRQRIRQAIDELPPEQRLVVLQRIDEDRTFAEIAASEDLPLGTVLTRMRLALKKLRKSLASEADDIETQNEQ